jgi:hypothetical protein
MEESNSTPAEGTTTIGVVQGIDQKTEGSEPSKRDDDIH